MATTLVVTPGISPFYGDAGALRLTVADLNITSYTTGGDVLLPETFGLKRILGVSLLGAPRGYVIQFITATNKLTVAWDNSVAAAAILPEVTAATAVGIIRVAVYGQ